MFLSLFTIHLASSPFDGGACTSRTNTYTEHCSTVRIGFRNALRNGLGCAPGGAPHPRGRFGIAYVMQYAMEIAIEPEPALVLGDMTRFGIR